MQPQAFGFILRISIDRRGRMVFDSLAISGLRIATPQRLGDERGWFSEVFRHDLFQQEIGAEAFVQHNVSFSRAAHTVRGLHFQLEPKAQGKLVWCQKGRIMDVAVDLRGSSATYGRHVSVELSEENGRRIWIPAGFAHGFCTLEPDCEVAYMVTDYYSPEHDRGLSWCDPALGIDWPATTVDAILSEKDRAHPSLSELRAVFP